MSDKHCTNTESHAHSFHLSLRQPTDTFGGVHCLQLFEAPVKLLHSVNSHTLLVLICKGSFALGTQVLGGAVCGVGWGGVGWVLRQGGMG